MAQRNAKACRTHRRDQPAGRQDGSGRWRGAALAGLVLLLVLGACRVPSGDSPAATAGPPAAPTASQSTAGPGPSAQWIADLSQLPPGPVEHLEVAYFHRTVRCNSCVEAERLTRKTLDTYFVAEVQSGQIALLVANVESTYDAAATSKYGAVGPALFLGVTKGGGEHILPVDEIWSVLDSEEQFMVLLRDKISAILEGND